MIAKKIIDQANNTPNRLAYVAGNECLTYKSLINKAEKLSKLLDNKALKSVIIYGDKSIDMLVSIVACLMIKKTYIPIDSSTPKKRVEYIKGKVGNCFFIDTTKKMIVKEINSNDLRDYNFEDIAYIIFTSGTSGNPKGVPISYKNLNSFIDWVSKIDGLEQFAKNENIKVLNQASFSFDLSVCDIYFSLTNGYTLIGLPKGIQENYGEMVSYIAKNKIDLIVCTPTFIKYLLIDKTVDGNLFGDLKAIYFCGEFLENAVVKRIYSRFPDINVINAYGPSEATSAISSVRVTKNMLDFNRIPVGEIDKACCKIDIIENEIVLSGNSVFNGYLDFDSDKVYVKDGINYFKTGDIGFIENNYLYCQGRLDEQIKLNGYRIELLDIENNISKINGVRGVVVCPVYRNGKVTYLRAYIENVDKTISVNYIKNELKKLVPNYMIPREIIFLDKIPTNKNYKYNRKGLLYDKC